MTHPYKSQADSSNKSKRSSMAATGAKTLPNLSQNGAYKDVKSSTGNIQQHKDQNAAPGMKRGGRLDKSKRMSKKSPIAREPLQAAPPSPEDMIAAQAGAGGFSPPPVPAPMMKKRGGSVSLGKYPIDAGAATGVARLELSKKK